jgi:hypothetical protein
VIKRAAASLAPALILALAALLAMPAPQPSAGPAAIVVTTNIDGFNDLDGECSLSEAIAAANLGGLTPNCDGEFSNLIEFDIGSGVPVISVTAPTSGNTEKPTT